MSWEESSTSSNFTERWEDPSKHETGQNEGFKWTWDGSHLKKHVIVGKDGMDVHFFPYEHTTGTIVIRGTEPLTSDQHFWEIELISGTDMCIGVGTSEVDVSVIRDNATSYLGSNDYTWGLESSGLFRHNYRTKGFCSYFKPASVIGVHLDMWHGTLSFYKNHTFLGIASTGLRGKDLYPMVSSVANQSGIRISRSFSFPSSLQYLCCAKLREIIPDEKNVFEEILFPAGLCLFLKEKLGWFLEERNKEPDGRKFTPELSRVRLYEMDTDDPLVVQGVFCWGTNADAYVDSTEPMLEKLLVVRQKTTPMFELEEFESEVRDRLQGLITSRVNSTHRFRSLEEQIHHEIRPRLELPDPSSVQVEPVNVHVETNDVDPMVIMSDPPQVQFHLAHFEDSEEETNTSGEDRLTFMDMHAFRERNANPNEELLDHIIKCCQVPEDDSPRHLNWEPHPWPNTENPIETIIIQDHYAGHDSDYHTGRDDLDYHAGHHDLDHDAEYHDLGHDAGHNDLDHDVGHNLHYHTGHDDLDYHAGQDDLVHNVGHDDLDHEARHNDLDHDAGHNDLDHDAGHNNLDHDSGHDDLDYHAGHDDLDHHTGHVESQEVIYSRRTVIVNSSSISNLHPISIGGEKNDAKRQRLS